MRRFCMVLFLLLPRSLFAQDTISVDAAPTMQVCSDKLPASAGPCATPPRSLSKGNPVYPEKSRRARHEGTVVLKIVIGKDGSAEDLKVVKSVDEDIDRAAITAVSQWKFEPATYEGNPVAVEMNIQVNFRLENSPAKTPASPAVENASTEQIRNLYTDADEAYKRHDYRAAVNLARRITSLSPNYSAGWHTLGISLLELRQLDAAASALETAIKLDPASSYAYNNLGRVYWKQQKYDEAAAQFRKQIVINPQDHYAHANLKEMLRDQKKCAEAMP
jgi:TonB family protein